VRRPLRITLQVLGVVVVLVGVAGGWLWWKLRRRIEPIPKELAALAPTVNFDDLHLPGAGLPDLSLAEQRGHITYLVLESRESKESHEGRTLGDALDRWLIPDDIRGFMIGQAEGLGFLRWKIDKVVAALRPDVRLPLYTDYDGKILHAFKLPEGHTGLVVLGKSGEVLLRHSGVMTDPDLASLRDLLGAAEPPPPPPAPPFAVGALTNERCLGKVCAFLILGARVDRKHTPGVKGGAPEDDQEAWSEPSTRLVAALADSAPSADRTLAVIIGDTDVTMPGWTPVADGASARAAFDVPAGAPGLVVVDEQGRLAFRETGRIPFFKLGPLADVMHVKRN
jgi:hypothetical protein